MINYHQQYYSSKCCLVKHLGDNTEKPLLCMHKLQLFRERLLEKVHATIPKGILGCLSSSRGHGRTCMFVNSNGKQQKQVRQLQYIRNIVLLIICLVIFRGCRVHIFSDNLSRNRCMLPVNLPKINQPKVITHSPELHHLKFALQQACGFKQQPCSICFLMTVQPFIYGVMLILGKENVVKWCKGSKSLDAQMPQV